jgi:hypothetical protein
MWSSCGCGARARAGSRCPHCGAAVSASSRTVAAALLGLTLTGCVVKNQPLYGVTFTDTLTDSTDTTESASSAETGDSGTE